MKEYNSKFAVGTVFILFCLVSIGFIVYGMVNDEYVVNGSICDEGEVKREDFCVDKKNYELKDLNREKTLMTEIRSVLVVLFIFLTPIVLYYIHGNRVI